MQKEQQPACCLALGEMAVGLGTEGTHKTVAKISLKNGRKNKRGKTVGKNQSKELWGLRGFPGY